MRHSHAVAGPQVHNPLGGFEKRILPPPLVHLQDLIVPGPVDRGFYVASGGWELVHRVQDSLVDLLWKYSLRQPQEAAENGEDVSRLSITAHSGRFHRRASQIGQIIWVDSGNVFDAYHMAVAARKRGLEPIRVLRAVKVGRPFTAFQFQQMLDRVPNAALWAYPEEENASAAALPSPFSRSLALNPEKEIREGVRSPSAVWWTPLVIVSDLMGLFYDSELPEDDLHRAFREFMVRLSHLRERAIVLALLMDRDVPPSRRHLLPEVLRLARRISTREE